MGKKVIMVTSQQFAHQFEHFLACQGENKIRQVDWVAALRKSDLFLICFSVHLGLEFGNGATLRILLLLTVGVMAMLVLPCVSLLLSLATSHPSSMSCDFACMANYGPGTHMFGMSWQCDDRSLHPQKRFTQIKSMEKKLFWGSKETCKEPKRWAWI